MEPVDDADIKLVKSSSELISDIHSLLKRILWKRVGDDGRVKVHRVAREKDLGRLFSKIEPFQEDPQLLDTQLKHIIPQLVSAYLESLKHNFHDIPKSGNMMLSSAASTLLYMFCKVRGEKVTVGFFNNEPKYLEPLLSAMERAARDTNTESEDPSLIRVNWKERYVLLLWLSHLLLAPFDLASISTFEAETDQQLKGLSLPEELPGIPKRIIPICLIYIKTATRERNAAAALLVRMCLRPDMRKIGLLDSLANWGLDYFNQPVSRDSSALHESLGMLYFLSGLIASGNKNEIGQYVPGIFHACQAIIQEDVHEYLQTSAIARKLIIKIFRNIVVLVLQSDVNGLDTGTVLEDVIGYVLESLADGDSPVRTAASKALSVIALQLDSDMATEVFEAILDSLAEDVLWEGDTRNLSAVNPLRWHGLTLTLAHLLYRRALPSEKLPEILNALLLALTFEQRSATGSSIGTSVRDSANFGIWAISRRYTTDELSAVETSTIRATHQSSHNLSVMQMLAMELLQSACLDPVGNIRRGSSAALQELIGRHPNMVAEGIPLVQRVDYHAVGLRERALCEVAIQAAALNQLYWDAIFYGLQGWRGIGSVDSSSRIFAANAIRLLSSLQKYSNIQGMVQTILTCLENTGQREIEERHGMLLSLAAVITTGTNQFSPWSRGPMTAEELTEQSVLDLQFLSEIALQFRRIVPNDEESYRSPILRPELTATAVLTLITALCDAEQAYMRLSGTTHVCTAFGDMLPFLELCIRRRDIGVLERIPLALRKFAGFFGNTSPMSVESRAKSWIEPLNRESLTNNRSAGLVIALGTLYLTLLKSRLACANILETIVARCTADTTIEARVVALQSLTIILQDLTRIPEATSNELPKDEYSSTLRAIASAVSGALNDYTINERGDIGSLVRLQALDVAELVWGFKDVVTEEQWDSISGSALRLSYEKLDKVRLRAARCLLKHPELSLGIPTLLEVHGVSSYNWFSRALIMAYNMAESRNSMRLAIVEGYCSSAGMGSESILQKSRAAFSGTEKLLPTFKLPESSAQAIHFNFLSALSELLRVNQDNDRVLSPLLETLAFLLESRIPQSLEGVFDFKWRNLLSAVQKSHYKSSNMHKLLIVLDVYRGLADISTIKHDVYVKVKSMLLHPFPKVRVAAAETMLLIGKGEQLKMIDWNQSAAKLKEVVTQISI